jgi:prepilin peptidase CpaA
VSLELAIPVLLLLVYAALHDLAVRTVPNWLPVTLLILGVCVRLLDHSLLAALCVAAIAFVFLFVIWVAGVMGGGDVKLWAATVLLIPPAVAPELSFFLDVLLFGGALALVYLALSFVVPKPRSSRGGGRLQRFLRAEMWRIGRRAPLPYACAIAGGAIAAILPHQLQP